MTKQSKVAKAEKNKSIFWISIATVGCLLFPKFVGSDWQVPLIHSFQQLEFLDLVMVEVTRQKHKKKQANKKYHRPFVTISSFVFVGWDLLPFFVCFFFGGKFDIKGTKLGKTADLLFKFVTFFLWSVDEKMGIDLISVLLVADATNALLKIPLRGERPFWNHPELRQFEVTCETSLFLFCFLF